MREAAGDQPLETGFSRGVASLLLPSASCRAAPSPNRGSSIRLGAAVSLWPPPLVWGTRQGAGLPNCNCGFGWDHCPSPIVGVIGRRGISSGRWVTFAELSEGFRHRLSTPANTQTWSLHLWKALKITLLVLTGIHTALGLQDISRTEHTNPLSSKSGFHSVSSCWH